MFRKLTAAVLSLFLLTACSSGSSGSNSALQKVSLVFDWYPNAVHTFVLAAEQQGYFKAEGLEVAIKMPAENPTDGIKLVGAGKETFAFYYQPDVLLARGEGIPIVSVGAIVRRPLNGIMVPESSGIRSPKELEGKKIGYPGIPLNHNLVNTMVKTAGGDPAKVTMTDVSWDLVPAIATKRTEAIAGGFVNHEKLLLEKQGVKMRFFSPADFGVPNYYELVLIAGEQTAAKERAKVDAMMRALSRGFDWVKQNPDAALKLLLTKQAKEAPLEADVEAQSLQLLLPWMEEPGLKFGAQKGEDWEKVAAWMVSQGVLKSSVKPGDAFVQVVK